MWPTLGPVCPQEWLHSAVEILLARNQGEHAPNVKPPRYDFDAKLERTCTRDALKQNLCGLMVRVRSLFMHIRDVCAMSLGPTRR